MSRSIFFFSSLFLSPLNKIRNVGGKVENPWKSQIRDWKN
ncbi:hypothetical protein H823_YJM1447B00009 [Saccharomyces cerevisiae YJM1447]|nr:hypothetical protein H823_YJM1447B00009 [Saccharomyces cerevisiae YJM1447]